MPTDKPMIAVYLEQKLYDEVLRLAIQDGRSMSNWVQRAIKAAVSKEMRKS
jgi:hypothetical protein